MKNLSIFAFLRTILVLSLLIAGLSSCYSVRVVSRDGMPEPALDNDSQDFYKNKKVFVIDTMLKLKPAEGSVSLIRNCGPSGFFALEYRVSLGQVLLGGITLGRLRKVNVKYVRLKTEN